jgi:hypothetical protein
MQLFIEILDLVRPKHNHRVQDYRRSLSNHSSHCQLPVMAESFDELAEDFFSVSASVSVPMFLAMSMVVLVGIEMEIEMAVLVAMAVAMNVEVGMEVDVQVAMGVDVGMGVEGRI